MDDKLAPGGSVAPDPSSLLGHSLPDWLAAILRICIAPPAGPPDAALLSAAESLKEWMADPRSARSFVPHPALLVRTIRARGIPFPAALRRRLEAAALREEKRSSMAAEQAARLEAVLEQELIARHPVRGWHFAELFYPDPLARHSHAIRWLVAGTVDIPRLQSLLAAEGWTSRLRSPFLSPHKLVFAGRDRVAAEFHRHPFPWTSARPRSDLLRSPEFTAVELIGAALIEPHARSGLWTMDMVQLVRTRPLDDSKFAAVAGRFGLAGTARRAVRTLAALCGTNDDEVRGRMQSMERALIAASGGEPRDSRPVRDLLLVQHMADTPRRRLLLTGLRRPDLLVRSQILRRDRLARSREGLEARRKLKEHQTANRTG